MFGKGTLNKVMLMGRLGADPEIKYTPNGKAVTTASLATNRVWKDQSGEKVEKTDWHRVVFWGKSAEILGQFAKKGCLICVEGRIETRSWDDNNVKRYITEIICEQFQIIVFKGDKTESNPSPPHQIPPEVQSVAEQLSDDAEVVQYNDDLPF